MRTKILAFLLVTVLFSSNTLWARTGTGTSKATATKTKAKKKKAKAKKGSWRNRGQKQIADDRTREIQSALVREGYLTGEPSGVRYSRRSQSIFGLYSSGQTKFGITCRRSKPKCSIVACFR